MKDWTGNNKSIYTTLGASNHTESEREVDDYYATSPEALEILLNEQDIELSKNVWECACGEGHLSKVLMSRGYSVKSTDLVNRGFGIGGGRLLEGFRTLGRRYSYQPTIQVC